MFPRFPAFRDAAAEKCWLRGNILLNKYSLNSKLHYLFFFYLNPFSDALKGGGGNLFTALTDR
jgi:hypothetical protein